MSLMVSRHLESSLSDFDEGIRANQRPYDGTHQDWETNGPLESISREEGSESVIIGNR